LNPLCPDSIRILHHVDLGVLRANPKVYMGYSDTTVTHFACFAAGLTSFYGPAFMAGFAENCGMHRYLVDSVRRTLFDAAPVGEVRPNLDGWTVERLEWTDPANQEKRRALTPSSGWRWLQGTGRVRGALIGGCVEVLSWLTGTRVWPRPEAWDGAVFFLETSEEAPPPRDVRRWLRHFAELGILHRVGAVLLGRPGGHLLPVADHAKYDEALVGVVRDELGLTSLPIVTGMDFGHTDPFFVLPYGVQAEVDCSARRFSVVESAVV
jgi:muramoyltetrapeptide carboxypeptidase LdcA involved in peptidoglycan recycling